MYYTPLLVRGETGRGLRKVQGPKVKWGGSDAYTKNANCCKGGGPTR